MNARPHVLDVRLPPERFYWADLRTHSLPRMGVFGRSRRDRQLGYLFESVLPVPVERLHAAYMKVSPNRYLACGMDRDVVREYHRSGALRLAPDAPPAWIEVAELNPDRLDLLTGEYEPRGCRAARRRATLLGAALAVALALVIAAGAERRADALGVETAHLRTALEAVYQEVLPPTTSAVPPAARLTAELRSLERTRAQAFGEGGPVSVISPLQAVLASWPTDLPVTTESLAVSATSISLTARVPDTSAAERLERELAPPAGWTLSQPSVQREREGLTMRIRIEGGASQ